MTEDDVIVTCGQSVNSDSTKELATEQTSDLVSKSSFLNNEVTSFLFFNLNIEFRIPQF